MILDSDAEHIPLLPIFCLYFKELFILQAQTINISFQSYIFCNKCWLSYFSALNNRYTIQFKYVYVMLNMFKTIFKWFVFI